MFFFFGGEGGGTVLANQDCKILGKCCSSSWFSKYRETCQQTCLNRALKYQGVLATPNPSAPNVGVFYPVNSVCIQVDGFFFLLKTIKEV